MSTDIERWFGLFAAFGRAPSPDSYAAVFHPDGEVADAGMAAPTPASRVREAIAHVLRLMPDLKIDMRRYRARGDTVFVEAANSGTINSTRVAWGAVYRVHLQDGLVWRGRRFYDQAELFRALRPEIGWLPQVPVESGTAPRRYAEIMREAPVDAAFAANATVEVAGQRRPLTPADIGRRRADPGHRAVDWAGDDDLAFVEWQDGDLLGVDRLDLKEGQVVFLRRYFDTLGLLAERDPSVTGLRAALLSNAR
jgi:hypothetical protein